MYLRKFKFGLRAPRSVFFDKFYVVSFVEQAICLLESPARRLHA